MIYTVQDIFGAGAVGSAAFNEISEIMNEFDRPNWIRTTITTKGKTTTTDRYSFSKFDFVFYGIATFIILEAVRRRLEGEDLIYEDVIEAFVNMVEWLRSGADEIKTEGVQSVDTAMTFISPAYAGYRALETGVGGVSDWLTGQKKAKWKKPKEKYRKPLVRIDESRLE